MEIPRSKQGIILFQKKYALEHLKDTRLLDAKPIYCPSHPNIKLQKQGSDFFLTLLPIKD